ncbi:hypothetical protein CNMCM5793_009619 [Aspergillus hiratsukae]|uniref:Uncharacterized protein n=1 Tax=Aspergillus hiratsukae TaxID=1194566 RepID=A0A8H6UAY7_9EURO|nr:hypothetical protein CNMCM5793_009619 [Aspergillus hiratsukae]KAF7168696.1 hypothetical protein CNMCM6106_003814 [Aspergillus hiratsukae]
MATNVNENEKGLVPDFALPSDISGWAELVKEDHTAAICAAKGYLVTIEQERKLEKSQWDPTRVLGCGRNAHPEIPVRANWPGAFAGARRHHEAIVGIKATEHGAKRPISPEEASGSRRVLPRQARRIDREAYKSAQRSNSDDSNGVRFTPTFSEAFYMTVTDGVLRSRAGAQIRAILEVKRNFSRLLISQDNDEVYLTLASDQAQYRDYLKDAAAAPSEAHETFLYMRSYGPWTIDEPQHLKHLMAAISAFFSLRQYRTISIYIVEHQCEGTDFQREFRPQVSQVRSRATSKQE